MKILVTLLALSSAASNGDLKTAAKTIRNKGIDVLFNNVDVDKNMVISPLSIMGCMYMLAAGAAGESRKEILETLGFGNIFGRNGDAIDKPFEAYKQMIDSLVSQPDNGYTLDIANGMFYQRGMGDYTPNNLQAEYRNVLTKNFVRDVSNIEEVDFRDSRRTTGLINDWIKQQTKNKIPKLFKQNLDRDTLVVLASTLYFKASWQQKFDVLTENDFQPGNQLCFTKSAQELLNNQCTDVTWMRKEENVVYREYNGRVRAKAFEMPLKNGKSAKGDITNKFGIQIWVPDDYITDAASDEKFRTFIKENNANIRKTAGSKRKATIHMPKFSIEYSDNIVDSLQKIGIEKVFDANEADLSPMLGNDVDAFVSKVTHGVKFDFDEDGIEGAAVTAAEVSSRTFSQPARLDVNRPFYFVVSNRCWTQGKGKGDSCPYGNVPLFVGRVVNPL